MQSVYIQTMPVSTGFVQQIIPNPYTLQ